MGRGLVEITVSAMNERDENLTSFLNPVLVQQLFGQLGSVVKPGVVSVHLTQGFYQ